MRKRKAITPWLDNAIQFPRVIEEAQAAGAFTKRVLKDMAESMDLTVPDLYVLLERARVEWERIKSLS